MSGVTLVCRLSLSNIFYVCLTLKLNIGDAIYHAYELKPLLLTTYRDDDNQPHFPASFTFEVVISSMNIGAKALSMVEGALADH